MRADNEIIVDRMELKRAVSWINRGKRYALESTVLRMSENGFVVEAPRAVTAVKSSGRWTIPIELNAIMFKKLVEKISAEKEVTLLYFNGRLSIGKTSISARECWEAGKP
jgi:hypothetical protein